MASGEVHSGACLCGAVTYKVAGPLTPVSGCHCQMCRKQTGHFLASTTVAQSDVVIAGDEHLHWYASSDLARRGFCGQCGSVLFWKREGSPEIAIAMGGFDLPTGVEWGKHIFIADKGDYYSIDEDAPAQAGRRPGSAVE